MNRNPMVPILVACAIASSAANAGEIFGKVLDGGAPAAEVEVSVKCGEKAYPSVTTDKAGSYHLVTSESGKCTITVKRKAASASVDIASYDDPVQCDLVLESKDGKMTLRRK